jgi:predicted metal-binding membrane protein
MTTSLTRRPTSSQAPIVGVLLAVTAVCWAYLLFLRSEMGDMPALGEMPMGGSGSVFAMPMTSAWSFGDAVLMWTMWAVMMAAMMIPSASPMIQAYSTTIRSSSRVSSAPTGSTPLFVGGYLLAWSGFAAVAAGAQWLLHDAALVDAMGTSTSRWVAGPVLVLAGVYQFSSLKNACLGKCRTPLGFLLSEWRSGRRGAVVMGVHHGSLCIGCCWALMALLFVLGVMNLWWILLVATVVLVEKMTRSTALPRAIGVMLIVWGTAVVAGLVETGVSA